MPEATPTSPPEDAFSISGHTISDRATPYDTLGFKPYVEALASFLTSPYTQPPITISIEGEWGSGKSSFLLQLEDAICGPTRHNLLMDLLPTALGGFNDEADSFSEVRRKRRERPPRPLTIRFNAWRHDKQDALWAAFALAFVEALRKQIGWRRALWGDLRLFLKRLQGFRAWAELILLALSVFLLVVAVLRYQAWHWLTPAHIHALTAKLAAPATKDPQLDPNLLNKLAVHGTWGALAALAIAGIYKFHTSFKMPLSLSLKKYISKPDYEGHVAFIETFHKDLQRLIASYAGKKRIYIFVDDLDRCDVPKAAELMQAINLMIGDSGNLFFILGMDREKVAAGVALKYKDLFPFLRESAAWKPGEATTSYTPLYFGYEYLEKFIQLSFTLPIPRSRATLENFLAIPSDREPEYGWLMRTLRVWAATFSLLSGGPGLPQRGPAPLGDTPDPTPPKPASPSTPNNSAASPETAAPPAPQPVYRRIKIEEDSPTTREIVRMTAPLFDYNPRRLKQFTNTFRLALFICSKQGTFDSLDPSLARQTPQQVGKAVALLLHFPDLRFALEQQLGLPQQRSEADRLSNSPSMQKPVRTRLTLFADLQSAALQKQSTSFTTLSPELAYVAHWVEASGSVALLTYETDQDKYSLEHFDASRLLTLLPSAAPPPPTDKQVEIIRRIAVEYERIRATEVFGIERTGHMHGLFRQAVDEASSSPDAQKLLQSFSSEQEGDRIVWLAIASVSVDPSNMAPLLSILDNYNSWFEHGTCISITAAYLPLMSNEQKAQIVQILDRHSDDIINDPGRSDDATRLRDAAAGPTGRRTSPAPEPTLTPSPEQPAPATTSTPTPELPPTSPSSSRRPAPDEPPEPPAPRAQAIQNNDIQHGRWGGKSEGHGCRLYVANVTEAKEIFYFNVVLEKTGSGSLEPPVVFHLHDSYSPSVFSIQQTDGNRAVLEGIDSEGTYTIGVQFKDDGEWVSLEYDLLSFQGGRLRKYDSPNRGGK